MTAAVPDPRFRDQLAVVLRTHRLAGEDHEGAMVCSCGWGGASLARHQAGYVAAEVEARVQAAANQRAAEVLRAAAGWLVADPDKGGAPFITDNNSVFFPEHIDGAHALNWAAESLRDRAAALDAES